jgi:hypothetical protein
MYREVAQWKHIRRRILEDKIAKKQVCRETGISRGTINKMLTHEHPPGYRPRPRHYPKLGPYIPALERLLLNPTSSPATDLTIRHIVERLRREDGFTGSYDSVRNYIRRRVSDDMNSWGRAYDLLVKLPKPSAIEFIRLLSRGDPSVLTSARLILRASGRVLPQVANSTQSRTTALRRY